MLKAGSSSTFFHVRIDLIFERNTEQQSEFTKGRNGKFAPNRPIQLS
jgi:hypothetical protein